MDLGLKGKNAVITGSSRGLGFAVADELAREGAHVVICGRDSVSVGAAKTKIKQHGGKVIGVTADMDSPEGIDHVLTMADGALGSIDILCMSTGGPPSGYFSELTPEAFTQSANNLIESLVRLIKGVVPGMQAKKWGRVMAVTSMSAAQPIDNLILSNTMRAGITGMMKSLANEYGPDGITFNCLMPGFTETERMESLMRGSAEAQDIDYDDVVKSAAANIPMRRLGRPEEFAALAAFLASERASYMTGCSIPVDGGWIKGI